MKVKATYQGNCEVLIHQQKGYGERFATLPKEPKAKKNDELVIDGISLEVLEVIPQQGEQIRSAKELIEYVSKCADLEELEYIATDSRKTVSESALKRINLLTTKVN